MNASKNNLPHKLRMTSSGFTLIELMVTIAVLAIIVGIAAPSISTQLANQRVKSTTATLENALKEAKIESVIRRKSLTLTYNNSTSGGNVNIAQGTNNIASYNYSANSTIKPVSPTPITFEPSKRANAVTYTICDTNTAARPRQIEVSTIAAISSKLGGTCP